MSETSTEHFAYKSERVNRALLRFLRWRQHHMSEKSFVLILALIIGVLCGFAALLLKWMIHFIAHSLTGSFSNVGANYVYVVFPVLGILIVAPHVRSVVRDNISHGVTRVLQAISQNKSRLKAHNM